MPTTRHAYRRTDDFSPGTPKLRLVKEALSLPLEATKVLIKVHAVALNYRDANISHGGNPWPVTPNGIVGNDAAGEVLAHGDQVLTLKVGDRVAPNTDTENLTGRESNRSWLAADEDGVLADYIIYDARCLGKLPRYLDWVQASIIPCAGVTAWSAVRGFKTGQTVLIQGTGGVAMFALKLAQAAGLRVILTSSSDEKLKRIQERFPSPPISIVNYRANKNWHQRVLELTESQGVDLVVENGGPGTLLRSMKCTRRGGTISQVGYLDRAQFDDALEILPTLIDRRINLRGINAGSKMDMDELTAALSATKLELDDILDSTWLFNQAEEALDYLWQGKQVGKVVISIAG